MPHPIFEAVLSGQYREGLARHAALTSPGGTDDRWAGYCLFALGELLPAKDLLLRARAKGCLAATLELTLVLRYLGELDQARELLLRVPLDTLDTLDQAYGYRERASMSLFDGRPLEALEALQLAWQQLMLAGPEGQTLRPSVAQLLGYTQALLGREAPSLHYLEIALGSTQGGKRVHALHTRAQVGLYAGRFQSAGHDLTEAAALLGEEPVARAYHAYLQGLVARAHGQWTAALDAFAQAGARARQTGEGSTECLAALGRASILTVQTDWAGAQAELVRADALAQNEWQRALVGLRRGAWQVAQRDAAGAATLTQARACFDQLGLQRETAWCDLHLCAASLTVPAQAIQALERAVHVRFALGSGAFLLPELRLLPQVMTFLTQHAHLRSGQVLIQDRQTAHPDEPLQLELRTLGRAALLCDGTERRIGLRRTMEVLAFLLMRGPASREQVLTALWPDDDPRRAANYFHQVRHELTQHVPWLSVNLDRGRGVYHVVSCGPTLTLDAQVIQRQLSALSEDEVVGAIQAYRGAFLPDATTEWAREERDTLEWSVIRAGLELMQRWSLAGEYAKCAALSRRLLDIAPCDESLVEYLVVATMHLEGRAAAQHTLQIVTTRAQRELNQAPAWHARLSQQLIGLH